MSIDLEVERIAELLPDGSAQRQVCPACQGGSKRESSFVVGRESGRVWWKCHRAQCAISGILGAENLPVSVAAEVQRAVDRLRPYGKPTTPLLLHDRAYFRERFEIDPGLEVLLTTQDEYILPVRSPRSQIRGYVVRQPVWKGIPKAPRAGRATYWDEESQSNKPMPKTVLFMHSTGPGISWYFPEPRRFTDGPGRGPDTSHLVIVEDQISAIKVAQHADVTALALLGNGLSLEGAREIFKRRPRIVTIALDPGAEGQAQNLAKKYGLYFERTRVVPLEADPKDIPATDLAEELGL